MIIHKNKCIHLEVVYMIHTSAKQEYYLAWYTPPPMQAKSSPAMKSSNSTSSKSDASIEWAHRQIPLKDFDPDFKIFHPCNDTHTEYVRDALMNLPALHLTINPEPNCTELHNRSKVRVSKSMLNGGEPIERAWQVGQISRKVGKTYDFHGTDIRTKMHSGMAVINAPQSPLDDPHFMEDVVNSLARFVKKQEAEPNRLIVPEDRGSDGKLMFFYSHRKSDEVEKGPDGKWRIRVFADAKGVKKEKRYADIYWSPNICNVIAFLPKLVAEFVISYLKGLAVLFECSHDEILKASLMLLDYSLDGGFGSHTDGIAAFMRQAGVVAMISMPDIDDGLKSLDLTPIWDHTKDIPTRITIERNQAILMTGLARVDEPHSVPFGMNRKGGRTLAFKFPFLESMSPYVRIVRSELSGVDVQMFDADMAIEAGKRAAALDVSAKEFVMTQELALLTPNASLAQDLSSLTLSAQAKVFTPFGAADQELSSEEQFDSYIAWIVARELDRM